LIIPTYDGIAFQITAFLTKFHIGNYFKELQWNDVWHIHTKAHENLINKHAIRKYKEQACRIF